MTGLALAVGAALLLSSSSKLGFMSWSIVPAAAIGIAICTFRKGAALGSAACICVSGALGAALVSGFSYSELKWISAAIFALYQQLLIRGRKPDQCVRAFLNNNYFGMAVFIGIALDYLFR